MPEDITTLIDTAKANLFAVRSQLEKIKATIFWTQGKSIDFERAFWTLEAIDQAVAHITTLTLKEE